MEIKESTINDEVDNNESLVNKENNEVDELLHSEIQTSEDISDELKYDENNVEMISLPHGRALTLQEIYEITATEDTKIIIFVGPVASGKTTIETMIYQLLHESTLDQYYFAGSKTLRAYEQRSQLTRTSSQNAIATTPRTRRGIEETFLHLRLWDSEKGSYKNLLLADLSGEDFQNHIANTTAMKEKYDFIKYIDYIVAVIDGEAVSNKRKRNGALEEIAQLIRTIYDAKITSEKTILQLVYSKYDLIFQGIKVDNTIEQFMIRVKNEMIKRLNCYIDDIAEFNIAAMPDNNEEFIVGYGIKDIMHSWMQEDDKKLHYVENLNSRSIKSEINKLNAKLLGEYDE